MTRGVHWGDRGGDRPGLWPATCDRMTERGGLPMARCLCCGILLLVLAAASRADTIREIVRFENQGVSKLRGIGIVTGLAQTGDSGKELAVAVQLASLYQNS